MLVLSLISLPPRGAALWASPLRIRPQSGVTAAEKGEVFVKGMGEQSSPIPFKLPPLPLGITSSHERWFHPGGGGRGWGPMGHKTPRGPWGAGGAAAPPPPREG